MIIFFCYYALTFDLLCSPFPWGPNPGFLGESRVDERWSVSPPMAVQTGEKKFHHCPPIVKNLRDFKRQIPNYIQNEVRNAESYGYPPDKQEKATLTVLEQAEVLSEGWAAA
jgi:hypothetical protein